MTVLLLDLRFVLRQMRRTPGFVATAALTLALGIAACAIAFGILQALVLRPLDLPRGERVMTLARAGRNYPDFSHAEEAGVQDESTVFSAIAPWYIGTFGFEADRVTRPVWGYLVSGQYFEAVGIKPYLGRLLQRADDDHPGASTAAVLSWPAWKSYFHGDPHIVGKSVRINKQPYTIVGVTPEGFYGTEKFLQPSLFLPLVNEALLGGFDWRRAQHSLHAYTLVRLKDGVTTQQAQAELAAIAARLIRRYPKEEGKLAFKLTPPGLMGDFFGAPARTFLAGVMALAALVLLATCANLGSLFAARTSDRSREIAIRLATGSGRWRIVRQALIEVLLISLLGGAGASALAWTALGGLANWHPPTEYPFVFHVLPQPSLLLTVFLLALFSALLFGGLLLRQIFRAEPNQAIKSASRQASFGRRWALRDGLLAVQLALCCIALTAAFVSLRGLFKTLHMEIGFQPRQAIVARFELSQAGYSSETVGPLQRRLLDRISQLPGVQAAAYADTTPLNQDSDIAAVFSQQTTDLSRSSRAFDAYQFAVSPGYFTAAETPLLSGREVSFADTDKAPPVAIVNREFARRLFHTEDAVGRYFKDKAGRLIQIVGMVADGKYLSLTEDPAAALYVPIAQQPSTETVLLVRARLGATAGALQDLAAAVRQVIRAQDPAIPVRQCGPWDSQLGLVFFTSQVATVALGVLGAFGLLLSMTGVFGLASYTVSRRLRDLSIRVALGAKAEQIVSAALGRLLLLLAGASAVGVLLGAAASRVLAAIVYHASAQDPLVLAGVAVTILLTAALAIAAPIRRALKAQPATLLRQE